MTRITNFGRKRTFLQAGFSNGDNLDLDSAEFGINFDSIPPKKANDLSAQGGPSTKRQKGTQSLGKDVQRNSESFHGNEQQEGKGNEGLDDVRSPANGKREKQEDRRQRLSKAESKERSEQRRLRRISERQSSTICFACREQGHAAKYCAKTQLKVNGASTPSSGKSAVGICYRCGSKRHSLSRCKQQPDPQNPLPFASCFVCSAKGHLASSCPQNKDKGIYPNGGCCKLCGENTHLAKDCPLKKKDEAGQTAAIMFGTGISVGADEDDFHAFKRKKMEVDKDEKIIEKKVKLVVKKKLSSNLGAAMFAAPPKKVVYF